LLVARIVAIQKTKWAITEFMNRLDGKPAEEMNINTNTKRDATDWTSAELVEVITNARTRGNRADQAVRRHRATHGVHEVHVPQVPSELTSQDDRKSA
jgi:hypothetical protein